MTSNRSAWILFAGDALCLAGFALAGLRSHAVAAAGRVVWLLFIVDAGSLLLTWSLAGLALGVFHFSLPLRLRVVWGRSLTAWLVAAPLGLVLRALLLASPTVAVPFVLVTLAVGGLALLVWRSLFLGLAYGREAGRPAAGAP